MSSSSVSSSFSGMILAGRRAPRGLDGLARALDLDDVGLELVALLAEVGELGVRGLDRVGALARLVGREVVDVLQQLGHPSLLRGDFLVRRDEVCLERHVGSPASREVTRPGRHSHSGRRDAGSSQRLLHGGTPRNGSASPRPERPRAASAALAASASCGSVSVSSASRSEYARARPPWRRAPWRSGPGSRPRGPCPPSPASLRPRGVDHGTRRRPRRPCRPCRRGSPYPGPVPVILEDGAQRRLQERGEVRVGVLEMRNRSEDFT
jgi:hypothetical protein